MLAILLVLAAGADRAWSRIEPAFTLSDPAISESSGIAASRRREGVFYTHNDSGDSARFFKFDDKGRVLGSIAVSNARPAIDWEDMAAATVAGKPYLYFGDIGDNAAKRQNIVVYRVPEPAGAPKSVVADRMYTLTYSDGPHNAEALMVAPKTGDLWIATKTSDGPALVFRLKNPGRSGAYRLTLMGHLSIPGVIPQTRLITGGDLSPDGLHLVLRTYVGALEYDLASPDWMKRKPRSIMIQLEHQGEGIAYSRSGDALFTSSEGAPCQISMGRLQREDAGG